MSAMQQNVRLWTLSGVLTLSACLSEEAPEPAADAGTADAPESAERHGDASPQACDPLSAETEPAVLGHVIAVGRALDGTLYVASGVDSIRALDRVFVSESGALQRKKVLGSGSGGGGSAGDIDHTASFEDGATPSRLVIKQRANAVVGIALVHDEGRSFFDALPSDATKLEIVDPSTIKSLPLQNLPGTILVETVASAPDGSQLVLTRPDVDWSYEDFRLYYGRDGMLVERVIKNASRGSNTYLTFVVDGIDYDVVFASAFLSPNTASTLRGKDGVQELTLASGVPALPEGASFECLR